MAWLALDERARTRKILAQGERGQCPLPAWRQESTESAARELRLRAGWLIRAAVQHEVARPRSGACCHAELGAR